MVYWIEYGHESKKIYPDYCKREVWEVKGRCTLNWLFVICVCTILTGCGSGSLFNGNKVSYADSFYMDYAILNKQEDTVMELLSGDELQVEIAQTKGSVDVIIGMDGEEPIYEGNDLTEISFTLNIGKTGDYHISVTGNKAEGYVSFERQEKSRRTTETQK